MARDILRIVEDEWEGGEDQAWCTIRDIRNIRQRQSKKSLDGLTPTQAFIRSIDDTEGSILDVKYHPDEPTTPIAIWWTGGWCLEQWKRFPHVLMVDNTYKTNRFKMPLFQVVGVTNIGKIFHAGFGLVDNERFDAFQWLFQRICHTARLHSIDLPGVVVSDLDRNIRQAIASDPDLVARGTIRQNCVWHMGKNVVQGIKRLWNAPGGGGHWPQQPPRRWP